MPSSDAIPDPPAARWRPRLVAGFVALALALHAALFAGAEVLVRQNGDRNPFLRILRAGPEPPDWVILGASHAMPLDFADMEAEIEAETGARLLNLAATGTGPFVHRLVAERLFDGGGAGAVLVFVEAFAFTSDAWNEARIGDRDMLAWTPMDGRTLAVFARAVPRGLPPETLADYATGFSKINNADRFRPDVWEAEAKFETAVRRPSDAADAARIDYLFADRGDAATRARYMEDLRALVALAGRAGARVVLIRPPLPDRFRAAMPAEDGFDAALAEAMAGAEVRIVDHSALVPEPALYFDTDHLNRAGVRAWMERGLADLLRDARRQ